MQFRIADTFIGSLARLTREEQKAVKTTAFDLQMNPAFPGMSFHRLDRARDAHFFSVRVTRDIRIIVHKTSANLLLCYVNHHDAAYRWAERRRLERHPVTGAAQIVELRETVREIEVRRYVETESPDVAAVDTEPSEVVTAGPETLEPVTPDTKPPIFADTSENVLLGFGVPVEWLDDVRKANEDEILEIAEHLPDEAAEALLTLAVGEPPRAIEPPVTVVDPTKPPEVSLPIESVPSETDEVTESFEHPDAHRRFHRVDDVDELARALDYPWDQWAIFLHPAQQRIAEADYSGPFRVSGSAGTGKTVVALHRAAFLAQDNPDARILITTFSNTLADDLRVKLRRLIHRKPRLAEQLEVDTLDTVGERLYRAEFGNLRIATQETVREFVSGVTDQAERDGFSHRFLLDEWTNVVDAWQLDSWESYRDVKRLGRRTRLSADRRLILWSLLESINTELRSQGLVTRAGMYRLLSTKLASRRNPPFNFIVVDEAQDISVSQLRFLGALGAQQTNGLFFAGDLGQRIFQTPFSWKELGVDIRGRSEVLKLTYRMSHQIRAQADRLLEPEISDMDGNVEDRKATVSTFSGERPQIVVCEAEQEETRTVSSWLKRRLEEGVTANQIGVFVRSTKQLDRARDAVKEAKLAFQVLDEPGSTGSSDQVSISTMHRAKGLEFRAVAVMACDDEVVPLQERLESASNESDLKEVYDTERHLLYVACTRARDYLLVTGIAPASEFLDDISS